MSTSDEALVARAREGDRASLSTLYRQPVDPVFRYFYARVANRQQAEDLTADAFTRMVEGLAGFDERKGIFQNWLFGLVRHVLTDHWRRYYKVTEVPLDDFFDLEEGNEPLAEPPPGGRVTEIMTGLPDKYRQVLELRILQGRSVAETAEAMEITENYVKVLQHRALQRAAEIAEGANQHG